MVVPGKTRKFYLISGLLAMAGWLWLCISMFIPTGTASPCIFKNITGYPCPSCGTTSSAISILTFHWDRAISQNPIGFLVVPVMLLLPVWILSDLIKNKASLKRTYEATEQKLKQNPLFLYLLFSLIAINWIWNLYK